MKYLDVVSPKYLGLYGTKKLNNSYIFYGTYLIGRYSNMVMRCMALKYFLCNEVIFFLSNAIFQLFHGSPQSLIVCSFNVVASVKLSVASFWILNLDLFKWKSALPWRESKILRSKKQCLLKFNKRRRFSQIIFTSLLLSYKNLCGKVFLKYERNHRKTSNILLNIVEIYCSFSFEKVWIRIGNTAR